MNYPPEVEEFLQKYDHLLLDERGIIKLFPAEFYHSLDGDGNEAALKKISDRSLLN